MVTTEQRGYWLAALLCGLPILGQVACWVWIIANLWRAK